MAAPAMVAPKYISPEEYLRREEKAREKSEYIAGRIRAMSGGSFNHTQLITNLNGVGWTLLRGKTCRFLGSETKVLIEKGPRYFYPDGTISCPPNVVNRRSGVIDNPTVIFEVLSPGSEAYDRGDKFLAYSTLASVKQIVLISSLRKRIDVWTRQGEAWRPEEFFDGVISLESVELELSMEELYENTRFEESDED